MCVFLPTCPYSFTCQSPMDLKALRNGPMLIQLSDAVRSQDSDPEVVTQIHRTFGT